MISRPATSTGPSTRLALSLLAAAVALLALAQSAGAAVEVPFAARYAANLHGDVSVAANTLMTCPASGATEAECLAARQGTASTLAKNNNNAYAMELVDSDADAGTFDSSSADLALPPGATVQFAGLYYGARTSGKKGALAGAGGAEPGGARHRPLQSSRRPHLLQSHRRGLRQRRDRKRLRRLRRRHRGGCRGRRRHLLGRQRPGRRRRRPLRRLVAGRRLLGPDRAAAQHPRLRRPRLDRVRRPAALDSRRRPRDPARWHGQSQRRSDRLRGRPRLQRRPGLARRQIPRRRGESRKQRLQQLDRPLRRQRHDQVAELRQPARLRRQPLQRRRLPRQRRHLHHPGRVDQRRAVPDPGGRGGDRTRPRGAGAAGARPVPHRPARGRKGAEEARRRQRAQAGAAGDRARGPGPERGRAPDRGPEPVEATVTDSGDKPLAR